MCIDTSSVRSNDTHQSAMLYNIADQWGYCCEVSCSKNSSSDGINEPVVAGRIRTQTSLSGMNICLSDLVTMRDNRRSAVIGQSFMAIINFEGPCVQYQLEGEGRLEVPSGCAVALFCAKNTRLSATYNKGDRSRLLVIQCLSSRLADRQLAEHLDTLIHQTDIKHFIINCRIRSSLQELFSSMYLGPTENLLIESCALELIARAVGDRDVSEIRPANSLPPRDIAKIHDLRDKLMLNLDAEHSLSELAREIGMSTSTLKSKFLAVTGQPVFRFLRDQRLERARIGLQHEAWTVSQAAYYVGYRHPTNFATAYKKHFGMAPTASRTID